MKFLPVQKIRSLREKMLLGALGIIAFLTLFIVVANKTGQLDIVQVPKTLTASVLLTSGCTTSELRNNFSGWVGFQFKVGSAPLTVSQLGRYVVSGSSRPHAVKLVNGNGTDVSGGSVTVNTAPVPAGTYAYTSLPQPITLQANATYILVSQELENGDLWYNYPNNQVTFTSAATFISPAWASNNTTEYNFPNAGAQTFGPVNLVYITSNTAGGTSNVAPTVGNIACPASCVGGDVDK